MYVTRPELELWAPPGIAAPGEKYWSAVMLGVDLPWFLLTYWQQEGGMRCSQTVAVAWESTLRHLIETADPDCVTSLGCFTRSSVGPRGWQMHDVAQVWVRSDNDAPERGPLLFLFAGGSGLVDSHGVAVANRVRGRRLLVKLTCGPSRHEGAQ